MPSTVLPAQPVYNLDQTHMRGLLVRPLGTSTHLEKPPRIFFLSGLLNEMVTIPAAANDIYRIYRPFVTSILTVFQDVRH